ncbi:MAG: ATP-dependent Clp protease adapter ClpS [Verrucomicrobia bacterium]|nr:MAG: ATP-dependent Clp protease adapter ClpS [Verrucomicrobiota bacterium]
MSEPGTITKTRQKVEHEVPYAVIVHDDPVNLMMYVTHVLMKIFGYQEKKAKVLMLEVHQLGRSTVWAGGKEKAEFYVQQLHAHQLKASLEKAS